MKAEIWDAPTRIRVSSESDSEAAYVVDLTEWPLGIGEHGIPRYNGSCQCRSFLFRCEPKLRLPENAGKTFRCKHINFASGVFAEFMVDAFAKQDKNNPIQQ